jgi:hypothetical protein
MYKMSSKKQRIKYKMHVIATTKSMYVDADVSVVYQ